jgi:polysaccharide export outer membrane protein
MKAVKFFQNIALVALIGLIFSNGVLAQVTDGENKVKNGEKIAKNGNTEKTDENNLEPKKSLTGQEDKTDEEEDQDATEVVSYYNNYLSEYKLGPNDIISVEVFGQCPDYCRTALTVPPTAKVSYPLIREGVFVGGRTTVQVQDAITKALDEYIIDPKVTVTLVKAGSARYAVMGKVGVPGVRIMDRKVSINEAILEAGGLAKGADKKKVFLARFTPQGFLERKEVDLEGIERGKIPTIFLQPGDQVIVGEKGFTWGKFFSVLERASFARILFGSPF